MVFISYSSRDTEVARRLFDFLRDSGIHVWWDKASIKPGEDIVGALELALASSTHVVCLISEAYLASRWCKAERSNAVFREISEGNLSVIPVLLGDLVPERLPGFLRARSAIRHGEGAGASWLNEVLKTMHDSPGRMENDFYTLHRRGDFVGRAQELDLVLASFRHPRSWLTTIEGIGGIGKTSLAVEAARLAHENGIFERVVFCTAKDADLSLQDVLVATLRTLQEERDLKEYHQTDLTLSLLRKFKTLILVDNFDTVRRDRAAISSFLSDLPPPSKALITSRTVVSLEATHISVGQMKEQDAVTLLRGEWNKKFPGQKVKLNFQILWERTGGSPLFMKLVMGQLKHGWPLSKILESLDRARGETFNFYEDPWSEMGDEARLALASLAVFSAPARWDSLLATTNLSEESLITAIETLTVMCLVESSEEVGDLMRGYHLHPLTKRFAESKLKEDPAFQTEVRRRFVDYFLGIALRHGGRAWDDYRTLDREQKNIFGAMELLAVLEDWRALVDITMQVRHFVIRQDRSSLVPPNRLNEYFAQAKYVCEKGLAAAIKAGSREDECRLLLELGNIEIIRGNLDAACSHLTRCVEICQEIGYTKREIMALRRLAHIDVRESRREKARGLYQESLKLAEETEDEIGIARGLRSLGDLAFEEGDIDQAATLYGRSLVSADAELDPVGMPRAARRIGNIYHRKRQFDEAARQFKWVIGLYLRKSDLSGACYSLYALGRIQEDRSRLKDALRCSLGSLRALSFVHKELWLAVLAKIERLDPATPATDELEVYVPSADKTINLCFDSIARVRGYLGLNDFSATKDSVIREWTAWEGEWVALVNDVVEGCNVD